MAYSEMDLWYLLNRKFRESADHGRVIFYEPRARASDDKAWQKIELLKLFGAEIRDMGCQLAEDDKERNAQFLPFYRQAIKPIMLEMEEASQDPRECLLIPPGMSRPHKTATKA